VGERERFDNRTPEWTANGQDGSNKMYQKTTNEERSSSCAADYLKCSPGRIFPTSG
jgi:hypothetical protein